MNAPASLLTDPAALAGELAGDAPPLVIDSAGGSAARRARKPGRDRG